MQAVTHYGRIVARAIAAGLHSELQIRSPLGSSKKANKEPLHLVYGASGFAKSVTKSSHLNKWQWSYGDDAFFVSRNKVADVIGVADGVGGWRNYGIDPSLFPCTLMQVCERLVREGHFVPQSPAKIIAASYSELLEQKLPTLEMAESSSFRVEDGDILMLATDGLFDNMSEDMIVRTLSALHSQKEEERIQHAASSIAQCAYQLSLDPDYMSPFAISACSLGLNLRGGKPDDITCIVARITHQSDIFM